MKKKILILTYDPFSASFRHRIESKFSILESADFDVTVHHLSCQRNQYLTRFLRIVPDLRSADWVLLQKVQPAILERTLLRRSARRIALDFDDAIYLVKPRDIRTPAVICKRREARFAKVCRLADVIFAGSEHLVEHARIHARTVCCLPTAVDVERYRQVSAVQHPASIVWIGLPENLMYLEAIRSPLEALSRKYRDFTFRVICSRFPEWPKVNMERIGWSALTEIAELKRSAIGVMPLPDDAWTRGKCAFKAIQYMAAGLPCVVSPVGANRQVIIHGRNGFLADTQAEWYQYLDQLLASENLRRDMGREGLAIAEQKFDHRVVNRAFMDLLEASNRV